MELVKSNQPEETLYALSIYHPSREEFSGYHYAYAQVLVQLNKQYLYAGLEADKEKLLLERAEVYSALVPF